MSKVRILIPKVSNILITERIDYEGLWLQYGDVRGETVHVFIWIYTRINKGKIST